jgi:multisubunit Na+/H+ antiporter MnhB subunit
MRKAMLFVAFLFVGAFLLLGVTEMRPFGEPQISDMDDYFIVNTQSEVAVNNVVTAVVFDYRGFDTLGEATVLFAAVVGILGLFRKLREDER